MLFIFRRGGVYPRPAFQRRIIAALHKKKDTEGMDMLSHAVSSGGDKPRPYEKQKQIRCRGFLLITGVYQENRHPREGGDPFYVFHVLLFGTQLGIRGDWHRLEATIFLFVRYSNAANDRRTP